MEEKTHSPVILLEGAGTKKSPVILATAGLYAPLVTLTPGFIPCVRPGDRNGGSAV